MRARAAAAAAVVGLVLASCGGSETEDTQAASPSGTTTEETSTAVPLPEIREPPPRAKSLVGTWSRIGTAGLIRFGADGEFRIARNELDLAGSPFAVGTYEVDGETITLAGSCESVWEAGLAEEKDPLDEELHVAVVEDGCGLVPGAEVTFVRISRD